KLNGPRTQPVRLERVAKDLEVLWLERPGVARDLGKVGIDAPLADLVADDRDLAGLDVLAVIGHRLGWPSIGARRESCAPGLNPRIGDDMKLVGGDLRPARRAGVEPPGVGRLVAVNPRREILLVLARRLVAVCHEQE